MCMSEIHASPLTRTFHHPGMIFPAAAGAVRKRTAARRASDHQRKRKARENPDYITRENAVGISVRKRGAKNTTNRLVRYPKPTNPWPDVGSFHRYASLTGTWSATRTWRSSPLLHGEDRSRSMSFNDADEMLCQLGASHLWFQNPRLAQICNEEKAHLCS